MTDNFDKLKQQKDAIVAKQEAAIRGALLAPAWKSKLRLFCDCGDLREVIEFEGDFEDGEPIVYITNSATLVRQSLWTRLKLAFSTKPLVLDDIVIKGADINRLRTFFSPVLTLEQMRGLVTGPFAKDRVLNLLSVMLEEIEQAVDMTAAIIETKLVDNETKPAEGDTKGAK